ncbi:MAG: hypothetical protein RL150_677 [Candidatus Parcubacteria bacterium]|jgi:probable phosphoglycerate mutase
MIFYFIRHGETDFNKQHRIQGVTVDEPLNEEGVKQMVDSIPDLPKDFDIIFSSSLKRVATSSQIVADALKKKIIFDDSLREQDFGSLAGKMWSEIPNGDTLRIHNKNQTYDYRQYGGESVIDVEKRIHTFIHQAKTLEYEKVLVVTSKGIIRLMYKMFQNKSDVDVPNGSVHTFEV